MTIKFFIMTRGRTGSTAVVDALNKSRMLCVMQELFTEQFADFNVNDNSPGSEFYELIKSYYALLMPYNIWIKNDWLRRILSFYRASDELMPDRYLAKAEKIGRRTGAEGFGFKVLSNQFEERPYLSNLLKHRGYRAIYLTRNPVRQVLSGMIANQRGAFNSREPINDVKRYDIDLDKFEQLVSWEKQCINKDRAWLDKEGIDFTVVTYEDFCIDRQAFFGAIFKFLDLEYSSVPLSTDFQIMIKDLKYTINNYNDVVKCVSNMGESI
jgi:LPS sulfotransferase NodH